MGAKFSMCWRRQPKSVSSNNGSICTPGLSLIELMKLECLKTKKMKNIPKVTKLTLEEWLVASPDGTDCFSEGELYVFRHGSKRAHPSLTRVHTALSYKATDSFSLERRTHIDKEAEVKKSEVSSISRTQSGKLKKKVRFRLPEEADIIIFYSPESDQSSS